MTLLLYNFWGEEAGQDLIEYTLLLAFILFCVIALIGYGSTSVAGIISTSNSQIAAGNAYARGG
jgi:Flp pilus assembly pilin Flp